jgi:hypothetical protein
MPHFFAAVRGAKLTLSKNALQRFQSVELSKKTKKKKKFKETKAR